MPVQIKDIIYKFSQDLKSLFGDKLSKVIVYGSYARGDYDNNSDIDVMILVRLTEEEIKQYMNFVSDCAFEYLMEYGVDISPVIKNEEHFEYWMNNLPYYRNIHEEGIVLNG